MKTYITLTGLCLLFTSSHILADRPAMDDQIEPTTEGTSTETQVTGDVIELQSNEILPIRVMDFPRRGMTMEKVKNELGEPLEVSDMIGKPPIISWTYNDRVVYFEYSRVVHVVGTH